VTHNLQTPNRGIIYLAARLCSRVALPNYTPSRADGVFFGPVVHQVRFEAHNKFKADIAPCRKTFTTSDIDLIMI
jgi:hypothetical protein